VIPRRLDEARQRAFIEGYEKLLNSLGNDEAVMCADAVHPTHAARPVGCWAPTEATLPIEQTSGRQRLNIHGAIDLANVRTRMVEVETVDAVSTIRLLEAIEAGTIRNCGMGRRLNITPPRGTVRNFVYG
jgi:hypothetical protein